jgi:hypothetical protein
VTVREGDRTRWAAMTEEQREAEVYAYSVRLREALGHPPVDRKQHRRRYFERLRRAERHAEHFEGRHGG